MHRLALLFQILCKYCLSSSLVQKDKIKNKVLQTLALLTPIQPPLLMSFLNFSIAICVPFEPHIIFRFFKKACLLLADLATHQSISAYLPLTSTTAECAVVPPQVESLTTISCLPTIQHVL